MKDPWIEAAECLRILSHPHRLQMVDAMRDQELSVGELAAVCGIQSHVASEHLKLLKSKGMISSRKEGRRVLYSIGDCALYSILDCIKKRYRKQK